MSEVSKSVDNLATVSREFALVLRSRDKGVMTIPECVNNLLSTGLIVVVTSSICSLYGILGTVIIELHTMLPKRRSSGSRGLSTTSSATRNQTKPSRRGCGTNFDLTLPLLMLYLCYFNLYMLM